MLITETARKLLPKRFHPVAAAIYWFGLKVYCPICGWWARAFRPLKVDPTFFERCSRCGSLARHRLIWLYLKNRTNFFSANLRVLHFAAEACFESRFKKMRNLNYTTADIEGGYDPGKEIMDVMAIPQADNLFDVVICIHVLQHVQDDAKAMREIFRVLKPGGWAILNSRMDPTLETTAQISKASLPEDQRKAMHANELYRVYGQDLKPRLESAGFSVNVDRYLASLDQKIVEKCFLRKVGEVYVCKKCE